MKSLKSLRVQIALAFFAVFLLISSVFAVFQFRKIKETLRNSHEEKLLIEGESLISKDENNPYLIPPLSPDQPAQIWVSELGGWELLYQHDLFPDLVSDIFLNIELELPPDQAIILDIDTLSLFVRKSRFNNAGVNAQAFILAKSNSRLQAELKSIRRGLTGSIITASLSALIVSILLANFLLNPLKTLVKKATVIKGGASMERLPSLKSSSEVEELSQTINEMIGRIENSIVRQNKFFDSASHELKTPLANMLAEIDYQLESGKAIDKKKLLKSLKSEVLRLSHVVSDFLLMSQIKNDQLTIKKETFRLDDLIYDLLEKMKYLLDTKKLELRFKSDEDSSFEIESDINKMEIILVNLLSNSLKYSTDVDNIRISLQSSTNSVVFMIRNTVDRKKLFNRGNQLGLWLSRELASKLGVELKTVKSEISF